MNKLTHELSQGFHVKIKNVFLDVIKEAFKAYYGYSIPKESVDIMKINIKAQSMQEVDLIAKKTEIFWNFVHIPDLAFKFFFTKTPTMTSDEKTQKVALLQGSVDALENTCKAFEKGKINRISFEVYATKEIKGDSPLQGHYIDFLKDKINAHEVQNTLYRTLQDKISELKTEINEILNSF